MAKKSFILIPVVAALVIAGCVKETYDLTKLSKRAHISPTFAVSAVRGDISLSDILKANDTVIFGSDNFIRLIFKKDSAVYLTISDFALSKGNDDLNLPEQVSDNGKGSYTMKAALFTPDTIDLATEDILNHLSGDFLISNPSITLNYTNSFVDPITVKINASGKQKTKTIDLKLAPFILNHPADSASPAVTSSFAIDKNNSTLDSLISMPPDKIYLSGTAVLNHTGKNGTGYENFSGTRSFLANLEVTVPVEFRMKNLHFADTLDNFMQSDKSGGNNPFNPEDFQFLRIDITAENGFPLGVSLAMTLYDSASHVNKCVITADHILDPAPVDANGKVTGPVNCSTNIEITRDFWSNINTADKIIFGFTMNTTDNGTKDVKIYSDYKINFKAALVLKPDIKLNLK